MNPSAVPQSFTDSLIGCYENATAMLNGSSIDILNQTLVLQGADGEFITVGTADIDSLQATLVGSVAVFAAQLGASLAIAVVLLLMTTAEKCKTLTFIFNMLALVCNVVRCGLQIAQLNSPLSSFSVNELAYFSGPGIRQATSVSVAGAVFTCLLFIFIELALIIQVRVVCTAASRLQRSIITWFTFCVGLVAVAFRINLLVLNVQSSLHVGDANDDSQTGITKAQNMSNISAIVSIGIFSAIFCFKLAKAIISRHRMGLKRFGAMQIIFIMGCQTLVLPTVFAIVAYYALPGAQIQSCVETIVAIFLPLSSIWASANTNAKLNASNHAAVMALPEHQARESKTALVAPDTSALVTSDTLVDTTATDESSDGLQADERQYRSKYDISSVSIDRYLPTRSGQDIEMQHPAIRSTSYGRAL